MSECKPSSTISLKLTLNMGLHKQTDIFCRCYVNLPTSSRMYAISTQSIDGLIRPAFQKYEHTKQSLLPIQPRKAAQQVSSGLLDSEPTEPW